MKDEGMFDTLVMAFREAITGIDFKYLWNTDGMLEMQPGLMTGIYKILCGKTDTFLRPAVPAQLAGNPAHRIPA